MSCARLLLAKIACFWLQAGTASPTASELDKHIEHDGAKAVIQQLATGKQTAWNSVVKKIDIGTPEWLQVPGKLLKRSDAGTTEDLRISLAVALTHNPQGVLRMTGPDLPLEQVCTVPFIEPSEKVIAIHKAKVHAALRRVVAQELQEKKAACLKSIEAH